MSKPTSDQSLPAAAPAPSPDETSTRRKPGRPCEYTTEIGETICAAMRLGSMSLRRICLSEQMPSRSTVFRWLQSIPEFHDLYILAKEDQADKLIEEMLIIADDISQDMIDGPRGRVGNPIAIQRAKIKLQTRQWILQNFYAVHYRTRMAENVPEEKPRTVGMTLAEFEQRVLEAEAGRR
jgi:hypothetical protein